MFRRRRTSVNSTSVAMIRMIRQSVRRRRSADRRAGSSTSVWWGWGQLLRKAFYSSGICVSCDVVPAAVGGACPGAWGVGVA